MRAALAVPFAAAALLAAALGGCGSSSSSSGTNANPATVTPAAASFFLEAVVHPEGALKTNALSMGQRLTGRAHPFDGLLKLLARPTGHAPTYTNEVQPWLGTRGGVYLNGAVASRVRALLGSALRQIFAEGLTGVEGMLLGETGVSALLAQSGVQGALVLDTTDVAKARTFLQAQAHAAGAHASSYRGVTFEVAPDGVAEGIVHRFAVIGNEAGLKAVIDTAAGSPALAHVSSYATLAASAEPAALFSLYLNAGSLALGESALAGGSAGNTSAVALFQSVLGTPGYVYMSAIPSASSVALDFDTLPTGTTAGGAGKSSSSSTAHGGTTGAAVLRGLPGDSWLAVGFGDLGRTLTRAHGLGALTALASGVSLGSISLGSAFEPLSSPSFDAQRNLLSWAGPAGIYASGASLLNLKAALVITSKDPTASRAAIAKIAQAYRAVGAQVSPTSVAGAETASTIRLPSFPLSLTMAYGQGKFAIGIGAASIEEALAPQTTLAGTPAYIAAADALGRTIQPSALAEFHALSGLLESLGLNQAQGLSGFASAIAPLDTLAVGGGESLPNGVTRARIVFGLQASSA